MFLPEPLNAIGPAEREIFARHLEEVTFAAGACIFRAGAAGDGCYVIVRGEVRLELDRPGVEGEGVLRYLEAGSLLGELALLDGLPRSATAFAETEVVAHRLSSRALEKLCLSHPAIGATVLHALGRDAALKLRQTTLRLADYLHGDGGDPESDRLVADAREAQAVLAGWDDARTDHLLQELGEALASASGRLASVSVEASGMGGVRDREVLLRRLLSTSLAALVDTPARAGSQGELPEPLGVVVLCVPATHPVLAAVAALLPALKAGNAVLLAFPQGAVRTGEALVELLRGAIAGAGAPAGLVQLASTRPSRRSLARLMAHPGVALVLAGTEPELLRAALSSGTPSLGGSPWATPAWICADADLPAAARAVVASKGCDHGLLPGGEEHLVVEAGVLEPFLQALRAAGARTLDVDEARALQRAAVDRETLELHPEVVGRSASELLLRANLPGEEGCRLIVIPGDGTGDPTRGASPTLAPIVRLHAVSGEAEALALCAALLEGRAGGHSAAIHTSDRERAERFARALPACRVVVNLPSSLACMGLASALSPSLHQGAGPRAHNPTADNAFVRHFQHRRRLVGAGPTLPDGGV